MVRERADSAPLDDLAARREQRAAVTRAVTRARSASFAHRHDVENSAAGSDRAAAVSLGSSAHLPYVSPRRPRDEALRGAVGLMSGFVRDLASASVGWSMRLAKEHSHERLDADGAGDADEARDDGAGAGAGAGSSSSSSQAKQSHSHKDPSDDAEGDCDDEPDENVDHDRARRGDKSHALRSRCSLSSSDERVRAPVAVAATTTV